MLIIFFINLQCTMLFFYCRMHNKTVYAQIGLMKMMNKKTCKDLHKKIRLEVDGKPVELPNIEGLVVLNISRYGLNIPYLLKFNPLPSEITPQINPTPNVFEIKQSSQKQFPSIFD